LVNSSVVHSSLIEAIGLFRDTTSHEHEKLPDTGFDRSVEEKLSPICIQGFESFNGPYGCKSSTVILIDQDNNVTFVERNFNADRTFSDVKHTFQISA
jgi:uncharacterized protein with NRDE domain